MGCPIAQRLELVCYAGGEPLCSVADTLAIFVSALNPTTKCRNRRLPRITQRDDLPLAPIRLHKALELRTVGSFSGAACFRTFRMDQRWRRISRGRRDERQSGSPPGAGQSHIRSACHAFRERGRRRERRSPGAALLTPKTPPTTRIFAGLAAFGVWLDLAAAKPPIL